MATPIGSMVAVGWYWPRRRIRGQQEERLFRSAMEAIRGMSSRLDRRGRLIELRRTWVVALQCERAHDSGREHRTDKTYAFVAGVPGRVLAAFSQ